MHAKYIIREAIDWIILKCGNVQKWDPKQSAVPPVYNVEPVSQCSKYTGY